MSDYTPITGELRERIEQAEYIIPLADEPQYMQVRINLAWLKEKLDVIDAIHAELERENAALKDRDGWVELRMRTYITLCAGAIIGFVAAALIAAGRR